jgi:dihydrofolate synthase/folylpolyglutamate synthase
MLIGVMADKDYALYPKMLGQYIDRVFTVKPDNPRALDSEKLAEVFANRGIPAKAFPDLAEGVKSAYEYAAAKKLPLLALGSLYMYKEFSESLDNIKKGRH